MDFPGSGNANSLLDAAQSGLEVIIWSWFCCVVLCANSSIACVLNDFCCGVKFMISIALLLHSA